jgi:carboxyl-terminal processing protease
MAAELHRNELSKHPAMFQHPPRSAAALTAAFVLIVMAATGTPRLVQAQFSTSFERGQAMASFEQVWTVIRDTHWQDAPGGLDWDAIRREFEPRIAASSNVDEVRELLSEMLGRLDQSHFGIIPQLVYDDLDPARGGQHVTGIDVRMLGEEAVVTEVVPGSPAEAAGVRPGWVLLALGSREIEAMMGPLQEIARQRGLRLDLVLTSSLRQRLSGAANSSVALSFLDQNGEVVDLEVPTVPPRGALVGFGNLPPMAVWYEDRRYGDVTYVRFSAFLDVPRIMPSFERSVRDCDPCAGIIIDLRGNPGGIAAMAMGMTGFLTSEPGLELGTMHMRDVELRFAVNPRRDPFEGPVAVLIDSSSASTAEIFAGGLQDLGRARIFGTTSAGAALPSVIERLPNGDGFQHAIANYVSAGGQELEGRGVRPDEIVELDRRALLNAADPVLDAALGWIEATRP